MRIKIRMGLLIFVITFLMSCLKAQAPNDKSHFKIIGYYSLRSAMMNDLVNVPFDKLSYKSMVS